MQAERGIYVAGHPVDDQTRCVHYHSTLDVVAIKFACCNTFYPCIHCHAETSGHVAAVWPAAAWDEHAVLCGVCRSTMPISAYLDTTSCPRCGAGFNPGCTAHHHLYFGDRDND